MERLCETKLDILGMQSWTILSPSVRKAEKYAAGAYFLIFMVSRDVLVTPGTRSPQVPLSAGRCHLKSQFFCAVAQHLAGSTMRYL